jgi:hypothetical protein
MTLLKCQPGLIKPVSHMNHHGTIATFYINELAMRTFFFPALTLSFLLSFSPVSSAVLPDQADAISQHLSFLGYDVSQDDERLIAKHAKNQNLIIRKLSGGLLLTSHYSANAKGKQHRTELLNLVNQLNEKSIAARYYIDSDLDLIIERYYQGGYDKTNFGLFLDTLNDDQKTFQKYIDELIQYFE